MVDQRPQYTVLARRFRPQTFEDVVGQQHVGQALRNAIRAGRVAHAYLFTGARGVGKTSTARIFAKALNCPNAKDGIPCNACDVCDGIGAGSDVDVLEIDGASNRGIDDIRQLRANVNVRSMRSPYKVYIIDEVHMLTKEAFNALLKTLEEPPPNVKFVFCTTEPNKLPDTILSRCQRFDFGTIASDSIVLRLQQIAEAEGREVSPDAVELVARRAAGSMRDSQSLFDQLLAFGGDQIGVDDVHRLLGTAPDDRLLDLIDALIDRRQTDALTFVEQAMQEGVQLGSFSDQLLNCLRDLMIAAVGADSVPLTSVGERMRERVASQAQRWGLQTITAAMQMLAETKARMQRVNYARALLELAIVRMSLLEDLENLAALVQQAASGEAISGISAGQARPAAPARPSAAAPPPTQAPSKKNVEPPPRPVTPAPTVPVAEARHSTPVETSAVAVAEPQVQPMELTSDSVDAFWAQLLSTAPDTITSKLKNASGIAISGPNLLQVTFPKRYEFSKNYFELPANSKKLETLVAQLAGREVSCKLVVDHSAPVAAPRPTSPRPAQSASERTRTSVVDDDPFVQQAVAIFGGQVVEVRKVLVAPTVTVEPEEEIIDDE